MRKVFKKELGITLVALIITIVVLLIIAVVAIGAVQESRIITHAQNAKKREAIKLALSEGKLENYGSNSITLTEIIKKYEGEEKESVSIAANAKSVPENMPAGNYYIIEPEKYASDNSQNVKKYAKLTSRGEEREENILKDVYVINEQLDIYYIIEASLAVNDENEQDDITRILEIMNLLNELDYDKEDPEEVKNQIKAEIAKLEAEYEGLIGKEEDLIGFYMRTDDYHFGYLYNPLSEKFFKSSLSDDGVELTYVLKDDEANEILAEMKEFKEYLKREFVGKTYEELIVMEKNNEIISKINNEFVASNDFEVEYADVYSDCLCIAYRKSSKDIQGERFASTFYLKINEQTKKVEFVQAGGDYLWGA